MEPLYCFLWTSKDNFFVRFSLVIFSISLETWPLLWQILHVWPFFINMQHESYQVSIVQVIHEDEEKIDSTLTSVVQSDSFLLIKDMHLANENTVNRLYNRCIRLHQQHQGKQVYFVLDLLGDHVLHVNK